MGRLNIKSFNSVVLPSSELALLPTDICGRCLALNKWASKLVHLVAFNLIETIIIEITKKRK